MSSKGSIVSGDQSVEELRRELAEAREQQAATAEILRVISSSPTDLLRVFGVVAASAARLCEADDATINLVDGDVLRLVAHHGPIPVIAPIGQSQPLVRGVSPGRVVLERRTIQIADMQVETGEFPEGSERARRLGFRTVLGVPLIRAREAIGAIVIRRNEVRLFGDKQIALLETFANQAVIAIENGRLFEAEQARTKELEESLEYQTATADVLNIISRSPHDLQPVFDGIVKTAMRLCDSYDAAFILKEGDKLKLRAHVGPIPIWSEWPAGQRGLVVSRTVLEVKSLHIHDLSIESAEFPEGRAAALIDGHRTILTMPIIRAGEAIGLISIRRTEVRPFAERQVQLLQTFADQAVIAIENARLFEAEQARSRELQDALEYQTATSDVLGIISRSPNELQPVFNGIVATAQRLCEAYDASIVLKDGERLKLKAHVGPIPMRAEWPLGNPGLVTSRSVMDKKTIHVHDLSASEVEFPEGREDALKLGHRSILTVPLVHKGEGIGTLIVRRFEVRPFTDRQIALLTTFANQAVIAIENTRLFEEVQARTRELTEALEQQTATADVLKVISRSALDLQRVLDALVESATRLCNAYDATILQVFGNGLRLVAHYGQIPTPGPVGQAIIPLARGFIGARAVIDRRTIQVADILTEADEYPGSQKIALQLDYRTALAVPLVHAGEAIGVIFIRRAEVHPFTERQVELVNTFADQAVIAIENTRLFEEVQTRTKELQESLEYQTATSGVLDVISRSPTDVQPVFDMIAQSAARLCNARHCNVFRFDGRLIYFTASYGLSPEAREMMESRLPIPPGRSFAAGRVIADNAVVQIQDIQSDPDYQQRDIARIGDYRSVIAVPMRKAGRPIGAIAVTRSETGSFPERQIELLRTFADQAVIAIENTRLFEEVQARNTELRVALEQQTVTSELLKVIGRSTFELQPVFETLAENAVKLCSAERAFVNRFDGQFLRVVATHNVSPQLRAFVERHPITPDRHSIGGRAAFERRSVSIHDVQADPEFTYAGKDVEPVRSALSVPMLKADELLGVIMIYRHEVRPFSDNQIALMETFADQAAIAIENTRLFEQVQARNRDLTALGEVGRAVSSTLDLKVVLKTIVDRAVELSGTDAGSIFYYRGGRFELGETTGLNEEAIARFRKLDITTGQTGLGEAIAQRQPLQVPDIFQRPSNPLRDAAIDAGLRAGLIVPLFSAEAPLGALVLQRRRPGEFPPAVVSVMQSFADQSAIALENARLFDEIAQKSRELEIASQHKSQFVANMSHELRTPLAAILGYAELMQEGFYEPLGQKSKDALTRIRSNGKHLLGLINTVLDIAKIESGQFTLNMAEYAIESVVETVRSATESLAQNKKLALKTEVAQSLPIGLGDEQRLTQVLLNLVGNAIKFTDTGEVRVTAKAVNGHFNVSVTDTGPGIPVEHQARIFEQFHQVDSSNTKAKGGTGLGLAISKQIVEMHGGRIWVESMVGKGSTFQMELPTRAEFRKMAP